MRFMAPPNSVRRALRNLVLRLSGFYPPARRWVDSGKMVEPFTYTGSPLITPDDAPPKDWQAPPPLGSKAPDAPCALIPEGSSECRPVFLRTLLGSGFVVLYFAGSPGEGQPFLQAARPNLPGLPIQVYTVVRQPSPLPVQGSSLVDESGALHQAFAAVPGTLYLIRPDGHISARRRNARPAELLSMVWTASGG